MKTKQLFLGIICLFGLLISFNAKAQQNEVYNDSPTCSYDVNFVITDGSTTSLGSSGSVSAGNSIYYTAPTGYWVSEIKVVVAGGGSNTAIVSDLNPNDDVDHCTAGAINVQWLDPYFTEIDY